MVIKWNELTVKGDKTIIPRELDYAMQVGRVELG